MAWWRLTVRSSITMSLSGEEPKDTSLVVTICSVEPERLKTSSLALTFFELIKAFIAERRSFLWAAFSRDSSSARFLCCSDSDVSSFRRSAACSDLILSRSLSNCSCSILFMSRTTLRCLIKKIIPALRAAKRTNRSIGDKIGCDLIQCHNEKPGIW